jgi:SanA protein
MARSALVAVAAGVAIVAAAVLVANLWVAWRGGRGAVAAPGDAPNAQVAIVLGARAWGTTPSPMLADRLDIGIELYKAGKVPKLLLSGDHGTTAYDEVNTMRAYVLARGVPPADVFTDHAGFSTYDTMYRARDVFQVKRALVVTQGFHLARAVYTARALGLVVTGVPADQHDYPGVTLQLTMRDWLARVKAVLQLHVLHAGPRFLGPPIPITGDGRASLG